ncbi:MAG: AsmA family protein [Proteobacteria bacterium]|nr:AsmA family protein [Pseudomonadota bacterium]MBU1388200.1 AsmA family protein [Pseudomonadota bacterium]MBU1543012.1 AsmA family protein [Pseudomonadota bacterium]MBU2480499.1 AsmA family protein [Pseudomonadota bacterium]
MKTIFKWLAIIGSILFAIVAIAAVIFLITFDVKKYTPEIEKLVMENTGRQFSMGDDIDLSVFPWVGVRLSDLHLGNPAGFGQKDMVSVKSFEVRLKVLPLLSKKIEVKTFVMDQPRIYLEKDKNGKANWEGIGPKEKSAAVKKTDKTRPPSQTGSASAGLPVKSLAVGKFAITDGLLIYVDQAANTRKTVTDLNLTLANISLENPVDVLFKAVVDGKPVSVKMQAKGDKQSVSLSDGVAVIDDTKVLFSVAAKEFDKPDLAFDIQVDKIDIDKYFPMSDKNAASAPSRDASSQKPETAAKKKTDYTPVRKLVLDGKIAIGQLKAHGAIVENLLVNIKARNGIITMDPVSADLYSGKFESKLKLDVRKNDPETALTVNAQNIQAGPLLKDAMQKELIEGTLTADMDMTVIGETPDMIKNTLSGKGSLLFVDGAVIGIDLASAVRNVKVNLGLAQKMDQKPRTDFAELKVPFTSKNGLVNLNDANLASPLLRVLVNGEANLVKESLDLRVDPKFVATLKGQGDTKERSGLMVPILITGSFAKPKIRPDLKGMLGGDAAIPGKTDLKNMIGTKEEQEKKLESVKEDVKEQIKGLIPGLIK